GVAIILLTSMSGFNIAFLNPKVLGIAQQVAELPLFSGLGYRLILFVAFTLTTLLYILWYCRRIQRDPMKSYMGENNFFTDDSNIEMNNDVTFNMKHTFILILFIIRIAFYVFDTLNLDIGMNKLTT